MRLTTMLLLFALSACRREAAPEATAEEPAPAAAAATEVPTATAAAPGDSEPGAIRGLPLDAFDPGMAAACQAGCAHPVEDYEPAELADQPGATPGKLARCPVSKVVFEVTADSPTIEHAGETYYACCAGCAERLEHELTALDPS